MRDKKQPNIFKTLITLSNNELEHNVFDHMIPDVDLSNLNKTINDFNIHDKVRRCISELKNNEPCTCGKDNIVN